MAHGSGAGARRAGRAARSARERQQRSARAGHRQLRAARVQRSCPRRACVLLHVRRRPTGADGGLRSQRQPAGQAALALLQDPSAPFTPVYMHTHTHTRTDITTPIPHTYLTHPRASRRSSPSSLRASTMPSTAWTSSAVRARAAARRSRLCCPWCSRCSRQAARARRRLAASRSSWCSRPRASSQSRWVVKRAEGARRESRGAASGGPRGPAALAGRRAAAVRRRCGNQDTHTHAHADTDTHTHTCKCTLLRPTSLPPSRQVHADFEYIGKAAGLTTLCLYGGTQYGPQESMLRRGVDVVVGTPGRWAVPGCRGACACA